MTCKYCEAEEYGAGLCFACYAAAVVIMLHNQFGYIAGVIYFPKDN
jgi:hypothetical protein